MSAVRVAVVLAAFTGLAAGLLIALVAAGPAPVSPVVVASTLPPHLLTPPLTATTTPTAEPTRTPGPTPRATSTPPAPPPPRVVTSTPTATPTPTVIPTCGASPEVLGCVWTGSE